MLVAVNNKEIDITFLTLANDRRKLDDFRLVPRMIAIFIDLGDNGGVAI